MPRRSTSSKAGVDSAASTSARKASTMRTTAAKDGTDGTRPTLKGSSSGAVSGKVSSTVGKSSKASNRASRGVTTSRTPNTHPAPKLGRSTAVSSPVTDGKYGSAKATNQGAYKSRSGAVSGKVDESWGQAPAKNQADRNRPYGT